MDKPRDAYPTYPGSSFPASRISPEDRDGSGAHFAAPLGLSRSGCLRFTNGAHRIIIQADSRLRGLYRARFGDRRPIIEARRGIVTIQYPRFPGGDWLNDRSESLAEVDLNASIRWDVEICRGASRLTADLRGLRLGSLKVAGGASRLEVVLPATPGAVAIVGGASNVTIRRPEGVAARLRVDGGATNLAFDDRHIGVAGGELDLQSGDYDAATDRYDIAVTGGANNMIIDKRSEWKEGADLDRRSVGGSCPRRQIVTSQKTLEGLAGRPVLPQSYYFDLADSTDAAATARNLEKDFAQNGLQTELTAEIIRDSDASRRIVFLLLRASWDWGWWSASALWA